MDVRDGSTVEGAPIVQMADNGSDSQLWRRIEAGAGRCKFKNKKSGMMLEVSDDSTGDAAPT